MKIFIDSSLFLRLLLDEPGADEAEKILGNIEMNNVTGYTTPMVLEEVCFKIIYAEASSILDTKNIWRIRDALKHDKKLKDRCLEKVSFFNRYVLYLSNNSLRIVHIDLEDYLNAVEYMEKYGLLPADAIHIAVSKRLDIDTIATFDEDFQILNDIKVIP